MNKLIPQSIRMFTLVCLLIIPSYSIAKQHEHHTDNKTSYLQLNKGEKWEIDSSLHKAMTEIKVILEPHLTAIHHNKLSGGKYKKLATLIDLQIAYIFENCKLPANADIQLHTLLSKIMLGTQKLKTHEEPRSGAFQIIQALKVYPVYFNDAHWKPLIH